MTLLKEISIVWTSEDIQQQAYDSGYDTLTDEQIHEIFESLMDNHDANVGINWEVISDTIDEVLNK